MVVFGALTLPASIPLLYSSYLATPPRSVEASQARVTLEEVEETTRRFLGGGGGLVGGRRSEGHRRGGAFVPGGVSGGNGFGVLSTWLYIATAHRKIGV